MKRIVIVLLLALFATTAVQAQKRVTLKQCNGDTVAYITQNFVEGKSRFIGQPFSKVIKEWESQIPIGRLVFGGTDPWALEESQRDLVNGASLYFITERESNLRTRQKEPYYSLTITFSPPYYQKLDDLYDIRDQEGIELGPKLYDLIKDYIVENLTIVEMKF